MRTVFHIAETIIKCEAASMHQAWLEKHPQDYSHQVRSRIEAGLLIPATQYIDALRLRKHLTAEFVSTTMRDVDVLHLPVMSFPVPAIDESQVDSAGEAVRTMVGRITSLTRPMNLFGLPALSVPCGFCRNGLPIGFQLVGHAFQEGALLHVAHAFQQATDHHLKQPVL
jgi:aspartyl-tRNA(Asn)/glutamyl-tRNA(Gln) amidotransferase subunit A